MSTLRTRLKRFVLRKQNRPIVVFGALGIVSILVAVYSSAMSHTIDHAAYKSLLSVIAKGESTGNYNAYFGSPTNTSVRLTDMTISEVLDWQKDYVAAGNASNAAGRYQIIQPTLEGLVRELKLAPSERFDEQLQDKLAITLMERRGSKEFIDKRINAEQFAASLAKEWAALPNVTGDRPTESFYAGDGLNESRVSVEAILDAVGQFKAEATK